LRQTWLLNTSLLKLINRRNSQPLPARHADTCLKTLYYQHLPLYFCVALTVMQSFKSKNVCLEQLKFWNQDGKIGYEKGLTEANLYHIKANPCHLPEFALFPKNPYILLCLH
jgi:hypothetical protein